MRKIRWIINSILFSFCLLFTARTAFAAESYQPLQVTIPVEGKSSYTLQAEGTSPASLETTVPGHSMWTMRFSEPGTYMYTAYDTKNPDDKRSVEVFITDNSSDGKLSLQDTIVVEKNGKKADSVNFEENKQASADKDSSHPKTGDRQIWQYLLMVGLSAMSLMLAWRRKAKR